MWIRCWTTPLSVKEGHSLFLLSRTGHRSRSDVWTVSAVVWLIETRPSHRIFSPQTRSHAHAGPQLIGSDCCESALWLMIMCFYRSSPPGGHFGIHTFPPLYSVVLMSFIVFLVVLLLPVFRAEVKHRVVQSLLFLWNDKCRIEMKMAEK